MNCFAKMLFIRYIQRNCLKIRQKNLSPGSSGIVRKRRMEHHTSAFCSEITEEILKMREKYPVKYYCPLRRESQDMLRAGGWHAACSVYGETFRYLLFERGWRPEAAEDFWNSW